MKNLPSIILIFCLSLFVCTAEGVDVFRLAEKGTLEELKNALESGVNFYWASDDETGETPLHRAAASNRNPEVIKFLIEQGLDVNAVYHDDDDTVTPLLCAIKNNNIQAIMEILKHNVDVNYISSVYKKTALILAVERDEPEIISLLLEANADPELKDKEGKTALDYANELPENSKIKSSAIFEKLKITAINEQKNENETVIKRADNLEKIDVFKLAASGTLQELQEAVAKGAKFDVEKNGDNGDDTELFFIGETPLHIAAAFNQNPGVIKFLVSQGLDVNAYAAEGEMGSSLRGNPLSCAISHKNINAVRELLTAGADPNSYSNDSGPYVNPISKVALEYDDNPIAQIVLQALLEAGSNVNDEGGKDEIPAEFKKSYLLPRSQWSSPDFRKNMTDVSNVDLSYFYGSSTPLMYAVLLGKINIVNTLLDFNANPNIYNAENKLALDYANEAPDYSTIKNSPVFNRLKNATTVASKAIKSDPDFDRADRLVGEGRIPMYVRDKGKFSYNPKFTTVHVNGEGVRLRSQPNTKSNVVGKASGSDFSGLLPYLGEWIHPKGEHWVLSEFNGKSVWIYGKYAVLINDSERFAIENNIRAVKEAQRAAQEAERNRIVDLVRNHMYYTNYTANLGYAPVGQQLERFFPGGEWSVEKNERDKNFDKWFAVYQATTRMRLNNRRTLLTIKFGQAVKNLSVFNTRKGDLALIAVYDNNTPLFLFEATNPLVRDMMNLMNPAFLLNPNSANRYQNSFTLQDFVETIYSID